jgi:DNA-directed RNA polymerase specialized sigma subunit
MITKEQLATIPHIDQMITSKHNQMVQLQEMALCVQSSNLLSERVQSSRNPDPMRTADRAMDMAAEIQEDINELLALRTEAAALFKSLPERDKTLMELRYLEGLTWKTVADRMNYSIRQIFNIHGSILSDLFPYE